MHIVTNQRVFSFRISFIRISSFYSIQLRHSSSVKMQSNGKLDCNVQEKRIQERIPLSTVTEKITIGEIIGEIQNRQPRFE